MIGVYNIAVMKLWMFAGLVLIGGASLGRPRAEQAPPLPPANATLTAVFGIKVGHHTLAGRPTGCTVVLIEGGATAGVDVRGAAPATRDTDLLNPAKMVEQIHGIALSGGSLYSGVRLHLNLRFGFRLRCEKLLQLRDDFWLIGR